MHSCRKQTWWSLKFCHLHLHSFRPKNTPKETTLATLKLFDCQLFFKSLRRRKINRILLQFWGLKRDIFLMELFLKMFFLRKCKMHNFSGFRFSTENELDYIFLYFPIRQKKTWLLVKCQIEGVFWLVMMMNNIV